MSQEARQNGPVPLWWGWISDYADEGAICVAALTEEAAVAEVRRALGADDVPECHPPAETTVVAVTPEDVDQLRDALDDAAAALRTVGRAIERFSAARLAERARGALSRGGEG